ncbi:AbiV family abortive infection protein [Halalkalibaculum sp. DA384]|uniref:AbiV family abortive infection protein n=1 Tax=Halalkalibaculum sp. DA384 TaxID=3373606 RepID=UPI003754874A
MDDLSEQLKGNFAFEGARLSLDNAINHFEAGELLAGKGKFGLATSHIILAAEECAKAMVLFAKYNLSDHKISDMPAEVRQLMPILEDYDYKKIFYSHTPKQVLASFTSFLGFLLSKLYPIPISLLDKILFEGKELTDEEIEKVERMKEEQIKIIKEWKENGKVPDLGLQEITRWWKESNPRKNNGFYVGIENGKWKKPQDFSEEDYYKAYNYVSGIIAYMDRSIKLQKEYNSIVTDYE